MNSLKASLIVALGLVFFSSCTPQYGCPYGLLEESEIQTAPVEKAIVLESTIADKKTEAIAR